jgi:hypothetical protein
LPYSETSVLQLSLSQLVANQVAGHMMIVHHSIGLLLAKHLDVLGSHQCHGSRRSECPCCDDLWGVPILGEQGTGLPEKQLDGVSAEMLPVSTKRHCSKPPWGYLRGQGCCVSG